MTDIDPRIQERRIEIIRAKGKKRLRMLLMLVLLILISLAAVLISKSSLLDVNEVVVIGVDSELEELIVCLLYTSPSPRDRTRSRMPSSA